MSATQSESIGELAAALAKAQRTGLSAAKDVEGQVGKQKRMYADLWSSWNACRTALADNGLAVVQGGRFDAQGRPTLATTLVHTSGQWITGEIPLITGDNKALTDMQLLGSAITYARRYGLQAIVGIVCDDDDGAGAGQSSKPSGQSAPPPSPPVTPPAAGLSPAMVEALVRMCKRKGVSVEQLCKRYGVKDLAAMSLRSFGESMTGFSQMKDVAGRGNGDHWSASGELPPDDEATV